MRQKVQCVYSDKALPPPVEATLGAISFEHPTNVFEDRLARIEAKLDRLAAASALRRNSHSGYESDHAAEDFQGDTAFQAPVTAFNDSLNPVRAQIGIFETASAGLDTEVCADRSSASHAVSARNCIFVGTSPVLFPGSAEYETYLHFFFADINPCHSCVNEADFRSKADRILASGRVGRDDTCFLALNYIIFACADILQDVAPAAVSNAENLPGWQWFQLADDLVGRRKVGGPGDTSLVQFLVYEAFYLMHADKPNAAYNSIGLACRRCFQFGLHQKSTTESGDDYSTHMRQRLLWTVLFVDRRISMSCGRPYGMQDSDIKVDWPAFINDAELCPNFALPGPNAFESSIPYLCSTIAFSRLAGEVWDRIFAAGVTQHDVEVVVVLDAKIKHWLDVEFPKLPLMPPDGRATRRQRRQYTLILTRFSHLRLLLRRRAMVSLQYDNLAGRLCGELAKGIVDQIGQHRDEIVEPSSFRFHMAVSLGGAVLVLSTLIIRDLSQIGLQDERTVFASAFEDGVAMLDQLAVHLTSAKRIAEDLRPIIQVANSLAIRFTATAYVPDSPTDLDGLFPQGVVDFAKQSAWFDGPFLSPAVDPVSSLVNSGSTTLETWETDLNYNEAGYGALWI